MANPKILIELGITSSDLENKLNKAAEATARLKKTKADLAAQDKLTSAEEARFNAEIKAAADVQRKAELQLKAYIAATKSAEGSIDRAAGVSKVLTAEFNALSAEERETTERGKELSASLKVVNDELRNQGVATGNMRANVGNYNEAINNSVIGLRSNIQALKEENLTLDISSDKFKENQAQIEALSLKLNVASGKVDEFGDRVKKSAAAENLDRVNEAGQGAAQAMGLFALATVGSTEASEQEQKVMQALQVVLGLYTIAKGRKAAMEIYDTVKTNIMTVSQAAYTAVVGTSTVAIKLFSLAMAATPWGLAVLALGTAIVYWKDLGIAINDAVTGQNSYIDALIASLPAGEKIADNLETQTKNAKTLLGEYDKLATAELNKRTIEAGGILSTEQQTKAINDQKAALIDLSNENIDNSVLQADIALRLKSLDNDLTKIQSDNNQKVIDGLMKQREERKKLYDDLKSVRDTVFGNDFQYQVDLINEATIKAIDTVRLAFVADQAQGIEDEAKYWRDILAIKDKAANDIAALMRASFDINNAQQAVNYDKQLADQATFEGMALEQYRLFVSEQADANASIINNVSEQAREQGQITADFIQGVGNLIGQSLTDTEFDIKKFNKAIIIMTLDTVQKVLLAKQAEAIGGIIAAAVNDPTNFLTGGAAGLAKAIAFTGVIQGLFSIAKAGIGKFEKGGIAPKAANGLLVGPSHAQGGIKINTPSGIIEAEGGEAIITRKATDMYLPLLSAINQAGGGVKFAQGGINMIAARSSEQNIQFIDYDALAASMSKLNVNVNVNEVTEAQNKVYTINAKATL